MPIGYVMIRGSASLREQTLKHLNTLVGHERFAEITGGVVEDVVATMGWPDFVVTIFSPNVELMKNAIVAIRSVVQELVGDKQLETSTIVGVSISEIEEKKKRLAKGDIRIKEEYLEQRQRRSDNLPLRKFTDKESEERIGKFLDELKQKGAQPVA
jgi:uncharacterized protein with GYD domain